MEDQKNTPVVTIGDWVLTYFITAIPIVGIIMLFVWGFSAETNLNKANWAKAMLIWMAIGIVLGILFFIAFGAAIMAGMDGFPV